MLFASLYFLQAGMHSHSKASRIYHYITLVVTTCMCTEALPRGMPPKSAPREAKRAPNARQNRVECSRRDRAL